VVRFLRKEQILGNDIKQVLSVNKRDVGGSGGSMSDLALPLQDFVMKPNIFSYGYAKSHGFTQDLIDIFLATLLPTITKSD
jgi:hypothetical protein